MVGDCDGPKSALAIEVNQLRNVHCSVAKGRMDMQIGHKHDRILNQLRSFLG